ncbi:MAG: FG-GAP-like repeat-containing protein, partial [Bacteroidota bacterium]
LELYLNDPNNPGNFREGIKVDSNAREIRHLSTGDLDGDGDLDVVAAIKGDSSFRWYQNDGQGSSFKAYVIDDNAFGAQWVQPSDIDQDGDMDIASVTRNGNTVTLYINEGKQLIRGNLEVCRGDRERYYAPVIGERNYQWRIEGGVLIQENNNSVEVEWQEPGSGRLLFYISQEPLPGFNFCCQLVVDIQNPDSIQIQGPQLLCPEQDRANYQSNFPAVWQVNGGFILSNSQEPRSEIEVLWLDDSQRLLIASPDSVDLACLKSDTLEVKMGENGTPPEVFMGQNPQMGCVKAATYLTYLAPEGVIQANWFREGTPQPLSNQDTLLVESPGVYFLEIETACETIRSTSIPVSFPEVFIPELFSPNADGRNDYFNVCTTQLELVDALRLKVTDRRGNTIYFTENLRDGLCHSDPNQERGWDGGNHPEGVYYWELSIRFKACEWEKYLGKVTLRR